MTGLTYSDVAVVAVIVGVTTAVVRRSYGVGVDRIIKTLESALTGDHDVRIGLHRNDALGRLAKTIDHLLAQRASESLEADGALEEAILKEHRVEELVDAGLSIASKSDRELVVEETLTSLLRLTPSESGRLVIDENGWESNGETIRPVSTEAPRFARWAMDEKRADYTNNVSFDDRCDEGWDEQGRKGEALAAPVLIDGVVRGYVFLTGRGVGYAPEDLLTTETLLRYTTLSFR